MRIILMLLFSGCALQILAQSREVSVNSIGMTLVRIEPGVFTMGSPESEEGHFDGELQHQVQISRPFAIGQFEVTIGEFRQFVEATQYQTKIERESLPGFGFDTKLQAIEVLPGFRWNQTGFSVDERHPVCNVDWEDAQAFCRWLSKRENTVYRLPTEAEWEYCCRAGTTTRYASGESEESLRDVANLADASFLEKYSDATWSVDWNDHHPFTAPVGSFQPNAWKLHDMHGNVWEWCADWYAADYFARSPLADPTGPDQGERRVLRGGAFTNRLKYLRSADRDSFSPKYRYNFTGFRVVKAIAK